MDGFPYVRVGDGPRNLVVLPGFGDAMFSGPYPLALGPALGAYFARYLDTHTVTLLGRPRGLPEGYTIAESADDHARLFESGYGARDGAGFGGVDGGDPGTVDVLGISMGGLIGQQLCARHPDLVVRVVIASAACRLGGAGRKPVERMLAHAHARNWSSHRAEIARGLYSDLRAVTDPPLLHSVGRFTLPRPADPEDVVVSLEAILEYDGREDLAEIEHPALVIGGSRDPSLTADVVAETAAGIPNGELSLVSGGKHGAFHERKFTFDGRVRRFLDD